MYEEKHVSVWSNWSTIDKYNAIVVTLNLIVWVFMAVLMWATHGHKC